MTINKNPLNFLFDFMLSDDHDFNTNFYIKFGY